MIVLGLKIEGHDTGAAIIKRDINGFKFYNILEERLSRKKHSTDFPFQSIERAMKLANLKNVNDFDLIVIEKSLMKFDTKILENLDKYNINLENKNLKIVSHHLCHAANVFYFSGYENSKVLIQDGKGSRVPSKIGFNQMNLSEKLITFFKNFLFRKKIKFSEGMTIYSAQRYPFKIKADYSFYTTSGNCFGTKNVDIIYAIARRCLDFGQFGAGKVMGLSAYHKNDKKFKIFNKNKIFKNDYYVDYKKIWETFNFNKYKKMIKKNLTDENIEGSVNSRIAGEAQLILEEHMMYISNKIKEYNPTINNLCISGGVALNLNANTKVLNSNLFNNVFVAPSSDDSGIALGAAIIGMFDFLKVPVEEKVSDCAYLGESYFSHELSDKILLDSINFNKDEDLISKIVEDLKNDKLIGLLRGRSENGPRALGHRSLLCLPNSNSKKEMVNKKVKNREWWRPFSPICMIDDIQKYFDFSYENKHMLFSCYAKKLTKMKCPAIVHFDNSARVQTVDEKDEPFLYKILKKLKDENIPPIILNTSFNRNGEPIVESPIDAYNCYNETDLDILVINNNYFEKK